MPWTLCFPCFPFPLFLPSTTLLFVHLMPLCPCPKAPWVGGGEQKQRASLLAWCSGPWSFPERSKGHWVLWLSGEHFAADGRFVCDVKCGSGQNLWHSPFQDGWILNISPRLDPVPEGLGQTITTLCCKNPCIPECRVNSICGAWGW